MSLGTDSPALPSDPAAPSLPLLPPHQLSSQTLSHSFPRPPTNHPFAWTTQLLCPAQLLGIMAVPLPPSFQDPPPSLITTLAPPGGVGGGTDLCLCLAIFWEQEDCFPLDIKEQNQIKDPQLSPLWALPPHRSVSGPRLLGQGKEARWRRPLSAPLSSWAQ